jgi:hypothetical protein
VEVEVGAETMVEVPVRASAGAEEIAIKRSDKMPKLPSKTNGQI